MRLYHDMQRLRTLDALIQKEKTGTPNQVARNIEISRSQLYRMIETLKSLEAPVCYSRKRQSFFYSKPFDFDAELNSRLSH